MISKDVITAALIGAAVTGVIPVIALLALLIAGKLKASGFWAGVLAFIIAIVSYAVIAVIASVAVILSSGNPETMMSGNVEVPPVVATVLTVVMAVFFVLSMGICIGACMKKTRTFIGALSCGLGFGASFLVVQAMSFFTSYKTFAQINSGEFDKTYSALVEVGGMDKSVVTALKESFTKFTAADLLIQAAAALATAVVFVAGAVFIMRGACARKIFAGIAVSAALFAVQICLPSLLADAAVVSTVIISAIGIAALIFALRMREKVTPPPKTEYADSFMQSVEKAKNDV